MENIISLPILVHQKDKIFEIIEKHYQEGYRHFSLTIPFSDPMDETIESGLLQREACSSGQSVKSAFDFCREVKECYRDIELDLKSMLNIAFAMGFDAYCKRARDAQVDRLLFIDLPNTLLTSLSELSRALCETGFSPSFIDNAYRQKEQSMAPLLFQKSQTHSH